MFFFSPTDLRKKKKKTCVFYLKNKIRHPCIDKNPVANVFDGLSYTFSAMTANICTLLNIFNEVLSNGFLTLHTALYIFNFIK
jgi:hypothetical protein